MPTPSGESAKTAETAGTAEERVQAAVAALLASRARLRQQLLPVAPAAAAPAAGRADFKSSARGPWRQLRHMARRWPVAQLLTDAAQSWWQAWWPAWRQSNPLGVGGEILATGLQARLAPLVQRHPVACVAGAAALGALLVAIRPWRWPVLGNRLRPLPGHVGQWLMLQLTTLPMQTALAGLLLTALRRPDEPAGAGLDPASNAAPATQTSSTPSTPPVPQPSPVPPKSPVPSVQQRLP